MDEVAMITGEPIRKRARIGNKWNAWPINPTSFPIAGIASLPVEIILEILSYLPYKDLCAVRRVSVFFERVVRDPFLWRTYEVTNNELETAEVIRELKRMPLLRTFRINVRADCDDILRQLSLTNKRLEELHIYNCTGSTSKLYLRSGQLIRILERCRNLHTINILGSRFRGRKFYRLLAKIGPRLKTVNTLATRSQFCTFIENTRQITEHDRRTICTRCIDAKSWAPFDYILMRQPQPQHGRGASMILISYLKIGILLIDADRPTGKLSITETTVTRPIY